MSTMVSSVLPVFDWWSSSTTAVPASVTCDSSTWGMTRSQNSRAVGCPTAFSLLVGGSMWAHVTVAAKITRNTGVDEPVTYIDYTLGSMTPSTIWLEPTVVEGSDQVTIDGDILKFAPGDWKLDFAMKMAPSGGGVISVKQDFIAEVGTSVVTAVPVVNASVAEVSTETGGISRFVSPSLGFYVPPGNFGWVAPIDFGGSSSMEISLGATATRTSEASLGPEAGDTAIRFVLNSGGRSASHEFRLPEHSEIDTVFSGDFYLTTGATLGIVGYDSFSLVNPRVTIRPLCQA